MWLSIIFFCDPLHKSKLFWDSKFCHSWGLPNNPEMISGMRKMVALKPGAVRYSAPRCSSWGASPIATTILVIQKNVGCCIVFFSLKSII